MRQILYYLLQTLRHPIQRLAFSELSVKSESILGHQVVSSREKLVDGGSSLFASLLNNAGSGFLIFFLRNPHLMERAQRGKN